jgi:hypothetical protein
MKLKDRVQLFKENNPDRLEHTFKNGMIFKGSGTYKLHYWIDKIYKDAENEYIKNKTDFLAKFLEKVIA